MANVDILLIIASFAQIHEDQVAKHGPQLVFVAGFVFALPVGNEGHI
jgi:hypothetical protein